MIISIINRTTIPRNDVQKALRAINRQMGEDFRRYWHRDIQVRLEGWTGGRPDPEMPLDMRGDAVIYLWDEEDIDDALGYHDITAKGVPFGFVFTRLSEALGEHWSVTLSHEVLELAMDSEVNLLAEGPHPDPNERGRMVYHWYELCDAVQASTYVIDGTEVSNFVLPHYFTQGDEHDNHNDFLGTGLSSFQVAEGGYAGFLDPETGQHATWTRHRDAKATKRLALKRKFLGASRAGRHQSFDQSSILHRLNEIHCDAIIFELDQKDFTTAGNARHYAAQIAAEALGSDWLVRPTRCDPFEFDAIYRGRLPIGFADAWSLTHDIAAKVSVMFAEPSISNPVAGETDLPTQRARTGLRASGLSGSTDLPGTSEKLWALRKIRVDNAWDIVLAEGKLPGVGIRIGHPDSGFRIHKELDLGRVLTDSDYDFLDDDEESRTPLGNHGLSTASVIMSGAIDRDNEISGPALHSDIVPLRVTKKGLFLPAPVLLMGGMRRLRDAIDFAVSIGCHVISMSLGGLPSRAVRKAVRRAIDADVIVLAAAGNQVGTVVWPARYPETIAVAASNINDEPWVGSSRGDNVDITAPGESVWRARVEEDNPNAVGRGDGTSYAVALTAGVACLWLAYHGRDTLIQHFGQGRLQDEFRALLKASANTSHQLPQGQYGAGLVDAEKLLKTALPVNRSSSRGRRSSRVTSDTAEVRRLAQNFRVREDWLNETKHAELLMANALGAFDEASKSATDPATTPARKRAKTTRGQTRPSMRGLSSTLRQSLSEK